MTREVVLTRTMIVAAVGVAASILTVLGLPLDAATQDQVVNVLAIVLPVVLPLLGALWARLGVTPVADPRDELGRPLVPGPRHARLDDAA